MTPVGTNDNYQSIGFGFGTRTNSYATAVSLLADLWPDLSSQVRDNEFPEARGVVKFYPAENEDEDDEWQTAGLVKGECALSGFAIGPLVASVSTYLYAYSIASGYSASDISYSDMGTDLVETNFVRLVTDTFSASTTNRTLTTSGFGLNFTEVPDIPASPTSGGRVSAGYKVTDVILLIAPTWPYTR